MKYRVIADKTHVVGIILSVLGAIAVLLTFLWLLSGADTIDNLSLCGSVIKYGGICCVSGILILMLSHFDKRAVRIGMAVLLFICIFGIANKPEHRISRYVIAHEAELTQFSEMYDISSKAEDHFHGIQVDGLYGDDDKILQFYFTGFGIAPSSTYYGFYYASEDVPVPYCNEKFPLQEISEDEWEWTGLGDNGGRIKKIVNCWYYYEAWF